MTQFLLRYFLRGCVAALATIAGIIAIGVAHADVVVIVNAANKAEIDEGAVSRIYLAQVRTFPGGAEAAAVDQKDGAAVREEFTDKLLHKAPAHIKSYWAQQKFTGGVKPLKQLANDDAVVQFVKDTPNAIGYVDAAKVRDGVKVVLKL
jgi:ABC-type phosphate transport system substrate-binding protein